MSKIFSFSGDGFRGGEVVGGSVEGTVTGEDGVLVEGVAEDAVPAEDAAGADVLRGEFCPVAAVSFIISSRCRGTGVGRRTSAGSSFSGSFADAEIVFLAGDSRMISFFSSGFSETAGVFGGYAEEIPAGVSEDVFPGVSEDVPEDVPEDGPEDIFSGVS